METTMATLNQYTRWGVGSFVRSFVRSAGRSVTQAKSPRGPIGHVRERSSLFHFQVPLASAASLLLPPPSPPLTRIALFPSSLSSANGVFIRRVSFRRYARVWGNRREWGERSVPARKIRHMRIAHGEREKKKIHRSRSLSNQKRNKSIIQIVGKRTYSVRRL